jgi:hypothetical protein
LNRAEALKAAQAILPDAIKPGGGVACLRRRAKKSQRMQGNHIVNQESQADFPLNCTLGEYNEKISSEFRAMYLSTVFNRKKKIIVDLWISLSAGSR